MNKQENFRKWLNKENHGTAFISASEDELKIGDCARIVTLDFCTWEQQNKGQLENVEYKIDTLYESIKEYRKAIKKRIKKIRKKQQED